MQVALNFVITITVLIISFVNSIITTITVIVIIAAIISSTTMWSPSKSHLL